MIPLGKQIQTSLRLISVSLSNVLYCIYDVSVVSRCTLYLNKILFTLKLMGKKICTILCSEMCLPRPMYSGAPK